MPRSNPSDSPYERGLAYFRAGNYQRCRESLESKLAEDPRNAPCLILKGKALLELDQPAEAIEVLQLSTRLAPEELDGWHQLGLALITAGLSREAVEAFRAALKVQPNQPAVLVDLGHVLFTLGEIREAIETLERAQQQSHGEIPLLRSLSGMYAAAGQLEAALRATSEILDLQPKDILANCDAAWLCLQLDRLDQAASVYTTLRSIDTDPEHELYAVHGLVMIEIQRKNWRRALDRAIDASRLDRYESTTALLAFISSQLFAEESDIQEEELRERFAQEHQQHRLLHAELA